MVIKMETTLQSFELLSGIYTLPVCVGEHLRNSY